MQYYTTSLPSFRKDNTFLLAFVDLLINTQLKRSNKGLLFIGRCDKFFRRQRGRMGKGVVFTATLIE